jgi:hypothetical protein
MSFEERTQLLSSQEKNLFNQLKNDQWPGFHQFSQASCLKLFFQGLGALSQSYAGQQMNQGKLAMAITSGQVLDFVFDFDATLSIEQSNNLVLRVEITNHNAMRSTGNVFEQDAPSLVFDFDLKTEPEIYSQQLKDLFHLPLVPSLNKNPESTNSTLAGEACQNWIELYGPGLGAGMYALSLLKQGDYDTKIEVNDEENQMKIKTWVSYLPLR